MALTPVLRAERPRLKELPCEDPAVAVIGLSTAEGEEQLVDLLLEVAGVGERPGRSLPGAAGRNRFRSRWTATFTAPAVIPSSAPTWAYDAASLSPIRVGLSARRACLFAPFDFAARAGPRTRSSSVSAHRRSNRRSGVSSCAGSEGRTLRVRKSSERWGILPPPKPPVPVAPVREEVLERGEQERPELPPGGIDPLERIPRQQVREEALGQVLGLGRGMAAAAEERVERIPVGLAQLGQCLPGLGRSPPPGLGDDRPARRRESCGRGSSRSLLGTTHDSLVPPLRGPGITTRKKRESEDRYTFPVVSVRRWPRDGVRRPRRGCLPAGRCDNPDR